MGQTFTGFGLPVPGSGGGRQTFNAGTFADLAALNVWGAANLDSLFNSDDQVTTASIGRDVYEWAGDDPVTSYPSGGSWQLRTAAGPAGSGGVERDFESVAARDDYYTVNFAMLMDGIPVTVNIGGSTVQHFEWIGGDNPTSYNSNQWDEVSYRTATESVEVGPDLELTSGGQQVFIRSSVTGRSAVTVRQILGDHSTPSGRTVGNRPLAREYTLDTDQPDDGLIYDEVVGLVAASGATEYDPTVTLVRNEAVFGIKVVAAEAYTGALDYRIIVTGQTEPTYSQALTVDVQMGDDIPIWFNRPAENPTGTEFTATLRKPDRSLFMVRPSEQGADIPYVEVRLREYDDVGVALSSDVDAVEAQVNDLISSSVLTGRNFERINTDLVIDQSNVATYAERIVLYAAGVDKRVQWRLPTGAQITAAGQTFPFVFETIHIGGTVRIPANNQNRVDIDVQSGDTARIRTSGGLINLPGVDMLRGDRIIWSKQTSGGDWFADRLAHDSSTFVLPSGVAELRDTEIQDVTAIAAELAGLSINKGDMFRVADADGGTYFNRQINQGDLIMALVDTPSLVASSEDFTVLASAQTTVPNDLLLLARNLNTQGVRQDFSRNVFVNESNVIQFSAMASGTPLQLVYFTSNTGGATARTITYANQPIQFTDLQGGTLSLSAMFAANSQSGFLPELTELVLNFSGTTFTFPLTGVDPQSGVASVDITIPNADYSSILNSNCDVTLNYQFRGNTFIGSFTVMAVANTLNGSLRPAVTNIANTAAMMAEQRVSSSIDNLAHEIDNDGAALQAIQPRISPYKTRTVNAPAVDALFNDSSGSDPFPSDLTTLNSVSADNPRFTGNGTALFVAVVAPGNFALQNITTGGITALLNGPTVSLGESLTLNNQTYFVYRVTGLTSGHVYEVERTTQERVVAWPDDINNLQDDVQRIDAELAHAALNLDDAVVDVLDSLTVTEQSTPVTGPTDYNNQLAGPTNTTQTVFRETSPNSPSGGTLSSKPISDTAGTDRARQKLVYLPAGVDYVNQAYLSAFDGSTGRDLIRYDNGTFSAQVFVPAKSAGSSTEIVYPAPATRVSGEGIWQNIETLTFQNGEPVPEADVLFFTRNIPSTATTLTIQYRGHANGNVFGTNSTTLTGVGGSNQVFANFTLDTGGETASAEVAWLPSARQIRVRVTEHVNNGFPTINDVDVILAFTETRVVPATPATVRQVGIEFEHEGDQVFAIKPSSSGELILVGDQTEINTGYAYTTLFGASENGFLTTPVTTATYLDYEDFEPTTRTITDLENHATLPQFGLFSTTYNRETDLVVPVTLQPQGLNVSNLPTSSSGLASGDVWNNGGTLTIVP